MTYRYCNISVNIAKSSPPIASFHTQSTYRPSANHRQSTNPIGNEKPRQKSGRVTSKCPPLTFTVNVRGGRIDVHSDTVYTAHKCVPPSLRKCNSPPDRSVRACLLLLLFTCSHYSSCLLTLGSPKSKTNLLHDVQT